MKIKTFAERLNEALTLRNMKPADLVAKSNNKLNRPSISQYLSGKYDAKQDKLTIIAKILRVNEAWLMGYDVDMKPVSKGIKIPVLGTIQAGIPIEAVENIIDYEEISEEMLIGGKEYFGLRVQGDSMSPEYLEGDILIVLKQNDCENGEDAIIMVNGQDATFKRVFKSNGGIILQPLNNAYSPIIYSNEDIGKMPIKIIGIPVEFRRNLKKK